MAEALTASFDLPADPRAAGRARRLVTELLEAWEREEDADVARLLVSEVVTNAVRFVGARPCLSLHIIAGADRVRITVGDGSNMRPVLRVPADTDESGRGMQLVAMLASHWGVVDARYDHGAGKEVWFELAADPAASPAATFDPCW